MATPSMLPENPLLTQIRQQRAMQPDTPPPSLLPPPGMDTGAPPIQQTPQANVVDRHFNLAGGAPRGTLLGEQQKRNQMQASGSGASQVYGDVTNSQFGQNHPTAGKLLGGAAQGLATLGDTALSAVSPRLASLVQGTTAHHGALVNQEDKNINQIQGEQEKEAQTKNLELQPQLKLANQALANEKQHETETHHQSQVDEQLHAHGFKQDEEGNIVPLTYEEMDPQKQAVTDLKGSQEELAEANAALKKAQGDPNSPQYRMAMDRIQGAQQARRIALQRLGLSEETFNARYHGTDNSGKPLPGAMLTDEGQPVGSSFSVNVRPTGTQRNKGNMAQSADQQLNDIKSIVSKRPDIFGPAAGRKTDFNVWVGSQDPDAQRFRAARTIAGDHLAGTFGGRSEAALQALDSAIGQFKDNPKALAAGLDQLSEANQVFLKAGKVHTVGSNAAKEEEPAATTFKVKLSDAMALPQNKGKSESDVEADVKKHGGEVVR